MLNNKQEENLPAQRILSSATAAATDAMSSWASMIAADAKKVVEEDNFIFSFKNRERICVSRHTT